MSNCKFKVGDYVIGNEKADLYYTYTTTGWVGKVVEINNNGSFNACGLTPRGDEYTVRGLNFTYFDLYTGDQPNKIVITTDGCTTTAKMYRGKQLVEVQTTKCHPDDRFDFKVGAKIALDRLVGCKKEEPKYYNGKMVCVNDAGFSFYTTGKIYKFVDGVFHDDTGSKSNPVKSFEEWQKVSLAKWLEVVE